MGYRPIVVGAGERALELARREGPVAIVLDLAGPGAGGREMLRALRADRETQDVPVVLCFWVEEDVHGVAEGTVAHLPKPISYDDLRDVLAGVRQRGKEAR
jgi:CheY-like chemotaxis protein